MSSPEATFLARRRLNFGKELTEKKGWYHSIDLLDGRVTDGLISIDRLKRRSACMPIPDDLRGKRVLDIGAWDGWFSFEMERRGAEVVAIDCVEIENFLYAHEARKSKVDYRILDVMELSPRELGYFDIVLFLGVLYHLKHPLIGLEKVIELTRDLAIVESYVADDPTGIANYPRMEFYEHDELGGQLDNWFGPSVECLLALCRTAGFARVELRDVTDERGTVACHRKWPAPDSPPSEPAPVLNGALHYRNYGRNFYTTRDDYISCWIGSQGRELTRADLRPEVSGFGVEPIDVRRFDELQTVATFKLPPGLAPGWHEVRVATPASPPSNALKIAVDIPPSCERLEIKSACDGRTWSRLEITSGFLSLWVTGFPENADQGNVRVLIDGRSQVTLFVGEPDENGARQVNAGLRSLVRSGPHQIAVEIGGVRSEAVKMSVVAQEP